jgi:hypothetical protein
MNRKCDRYVADTKALLYRRSSHSRSGTGAGIVVKPFAWRAQYPFVRDLPIVKQSRRNFGEGRTSVVSADSDVAVALRHRKIKKRTAVYSSILGSMTK